VWLKLVPSKGPSRIGVSISAPENGNKSSFRNVAFYSFQNTLRWTNSGNLVILSVIHHRHNSLEYSGTPCICNCLLHSIVLLKIILPDVVVSCTFLSLGINVIINILGIFCCNILIFISAKVARKPQSAETLSGALLAWLMCVVVKNTIFKLVASLSREREDRHPHKMTTARLELCSPSS
jgi:hypothetical protein